MNISKGVSCVLVHAMVVGPFSPRNAIIRKSIVEIVVPHRLVTYPAGRAAKKQEQKFQQLYAAGNMLIAKECF